MKKKISDYLHLYLGCDVEIPLGVFKLIGIEEQSMIVWNKVYGRKVYSFQIGIKPILRSLSDITEKDEIQILWYLPVYVGHETNLEHHFIQALINGTKYRVDFMDSPEIARTLCRLGFDAFGLIEAGLAIDKTQTPASHE